MLGTIELWQAGRFPITTRPFGGEDLSAPARDTVRVKPAFDRFSKRRYGSGSLGQRELAISVCRHCIAALAKGGVAAAVAHDPADLLPLDIAVDTGHPGIDLGE
jgi:hypothetical protein